MTKMFNSVEEMNEFLAGGKLVSGMSFVSGMITLTIDEDRCTSTRVDAPKAAEKSLKDYSDEIDSVFGLKVANGTFNIDRTMMKAIIQFCSGIPYSIAKALVTKYSNYSRYMSSYEALDELEKLRNDNK